MAKQTPFAIMSDSPDVASGLGRITRELAQRLYTAHLPIRLATIGFGGQGNKDLPWQQYNIGNYNTAADIGKTIPSLADWFGGEEGVLLTIFDLHRLEPFRFSQLYGEPWHSFLGAQKFKTWAYIPVDGNSPNGAFPLQSCEVLRAFDRVLAYGPYGKQVLGNCLSLLNPPNDRVKPNEVEWLPHGIDMGVFRDMGQGERAQITRQVKSDIDPTGQRTLSVGPEDRLLGVVATNNPRKDWGSAFKVMSKLGPDWKFWLHTDHLVKYWNLAELTEQHGLNDRMFVTFQADDESLAKLYSACDVTLGPGAEGFGFPLIESMACGTPVVHTRIAGGADLLPAQSLVEPFGTRTEGPLCIERPVMDVDAVCDRIRAIATMGRWGRSQVEHYDWKAVFPQWKVWIQRGLNG